METWWSGATLTKEQRRSFLTFARYWHLPLSPRPSWSYVIEQISACFEHLKNGDADQPSVTPVDESFHGCAKCVWSTMASTSYDPSTA